MDEYTEGWNLLRWERDKSEELGICLVEGKSLRP